MLEQGDYYCGIGGHELVGDGRHWETTDPAWVHGVDNIAEPD